MKYIPTHKIITECSGSCQTYDDYDCPEYSAFFILCIHSKGDQQWFQVRQHVDHNADDQADIADQLKDPEGAKNKAADCEKQQHMHDQKQDHGDSAVSPNQKQPIFTLIANTGTKTDSKTVSHQNKTDHYMNQQENGHKIGEFVQNIKSAGDQSYHDSSSGDGVKDDQDDQQQTDPGIDSAKFHCIHIIPPIR